MSFVRCFLALAASQQWFLEQLHVNNAFLHSDLTEEVYMVVPPGFAKEGESKGCKLLKSLYRLKQASRQWFHKLSEALFSLGYEQSKAYYSLFTKVHGSSFTTLLVYIDDILLASNDMSYITQGKAYLDARFKIKDLEKLKYFLGLEVARTTTGISINQRKYALEILEDSGYLGCKPATFPMDSKLKLSKFDSDVLTDASFCRCIIGHLLYLTITRPDLSYSVNTLAQFMDKSGQSHLNATYHVLRYLKSTPAHGLFFSLIFFYSVNHFL